MAFRLKSHPRIKNKPLHCRNGNHGPWETVVVAGVPTLVCKGCGATIFKTLEEHTYTKGDEKKRFKPHLDAMEQRRALLKKKLIEEKLLPDDL